MPPRQRDRAVPEVITHRARRVTSVDIRSEILMAERRFTSYAHEEFSADQLARFAEQYDGVDMATLKGAAPDRFPILVRSESHPLGYDVCWWNRYCGITIGCASHLTNYRAMADNQAMQTQPSIGRFDLR